MKLLTITLRSLSVRKMATWLSGFIAALFMEFVIEVVKAYLNLNL